MQISPHRRILFAVDDSPHCQQAFQWFLKWMWRKGNPPSTLSQIPEGEAPNRITPVDKLEPEEDAITLIHIIPPELTTSSNHVSETEVLISSNRLENGEGGSQGMLNFMKDAFTAGKAVCQVFLKMAKEAGATRCDACIAVDRRQSIGKAILRSAEIRGADMIVMGSHGHGAIHRAVHFGSVNKYIARHSRIPITVIPP
nr:universal stress protein [Hymenolepis microstoma]